jgi:hypothetical protein
MNMTSEDLSSEIRHFSAELKRLEQRLKSEPTPDAAVLNEFRHAVDNVRLTAWSVSELINAERIKKNPDTVLDFLSAERLRRFEQLVSSLCGDIERGLITVRTDGVQALCESVNGLQQRLVQAIKQRTQAYKVKDAARWNLTSRRLVQGYWGMSTRLSQAVPIFHQIHAHFGLCPESFFKAASCADQWNVTGVNLWINTPPAPGASNVTRNKTAFRSTLPHETQPVSISWNLHFLAYLCTTFYFVSTAFRLGLLQTKCNVCQRQKLVTFSGLNPAKLPIALVRGLLEAWAWSDPQVACAICIVAVLGFLRHSTHLITEQSPTRKRYLAFGGRARPSP